MAVGDQTLILVQQNIFPEVPVIPVFGPLEDVEWSLVADIGGAIKIPDSASISSTGDTLELVFTGVIVGDYRLVIPAWSEAFRGQFGAWIAPTIVPVQCTV